MTVMFCDLVDSTKLTGVLDAEDFREVLTDYRQVCLQAVERFGGFTAVYAGDGMTVYFGYPRAHEDDAQRAIHTGLAILDEMAALNARLVDLYAVSVQVRIGVHSGVVIAEELGGSAAETRSQLDVSGEMPHIASRLESIAPPGSIVISGATHELIEGYFDVEPLGEQPLKGVARPVSVFRVLGPTGAVGRLEVADARRLTPVVGRDAELGVLTDAWRNAAAGAGAVVHVAGEAGIGKSRLVVELGDAVAAQAGDLQRWQCSPHYRSTLLHPVITFLERWLGLSRGATADEQLAVIEEAVVAAGLDPIEAVPLLADLVSIPTDREHGLTPRDARTALLHVLESLLVTTPARHPLLLVVEDLHWADATTVELLGRIVRRLRRLPVLCVLTFRGNFEPPWADHRSVLEVRLEPLTPAEVRVMATHATDGTVDPAVLEWVESTADGVPLFVEEMLKAGRAPEEAMVPPTLQGLLTERLDRLPELSDVIDVAAVLGREFEYAHLAALEPLPGGVLEPALAQLASQDVVRPVEGAPSRFEFSHGLLHEAAYARILRRRQRTLHSRVATTLSSSFVDLVEREPEVVARHWSSADQHREAVPFWHAAGTRALERAAYVEAAEHFRRGLAELDAAGADDDLPHVDFLTHIGAALQAGHGYSARGVNEAYTRARSACERICNEERLLPIIRGQWAYHLLRGDHDTALERADEMLALARRLGSTSALGEGHMDRGFVHMYLGHFDLARENMETAVRLYERPEHPDHVHEAQGDTFISAPAYLAVVFWNLGYPDEAQRFSDLSIERAEQESGPVARAQAWGMRTILHLSRAEPAELAEALEKTRMQSIDNDLGYWRTVSSLLYWWLRGRTGEVESSSERVRRSLDEYQASGSRLGLPQLQLLAADLRRVAGDKQGALDLLRVGEDYMEETGERQSESELYRFKGRLLMTGADADPEAATEAFERAMRVARAQNARLLEVQSATRLAEHQLRLGTPCTALDRVAELVEWFGPGCRLIDVERARALVTTEAISR
jgi:class 3 adenylate cyclase/tetratricopeptide (TPR) repeat protein